MSEQDSHFLGRWSRRKQQAREEADAPGPQAATPPAAATDEPVDEGAPGAGPALSAEEIAALPDPDSLEAGADFKVYLRTGVPAALRRKALRRLWRVNPIIGALDGLNDYDLDYTDKATVVANLKTLYQAGRGMVEPESPPAEDAPAEDAAPGDAPSGETPSGEAMAAGAPAAPAVEAGAEAAGSEAEPSEPEAESAVDGSGEAGLLSDVSQNRDPVGEAVPDRKAPAAARRWSLDRA